MTYNSGCGYGCCGSMYQNDSKKQYGVGCTCNGIGPCRGTCRK
ncbi:MAG: hypothetical protein V1702_04910 [Candidatus Woesearchaeota archaeon]